MLSAARLWARPGGAGAALLGVWWAWVAGYAWVLALVAWFALMCAAALMSAARRRALPSPAPAAEVPAERAPAVTRHAGAA